MVASSTISELYASAGPTTTPARTSGLGSLSSGETSYMEAHTSTASSPSIMRVMKVALPYSAGPAPLAFNACQRR